MKMTDEQKVEYLRSAMEIFIGAGEWIQREVRTRNYGNIKSRAEGIVYRAKLALDATDDGKRMKLPTDAEFDFGVTLDSDTLKDILNQLDEIEKYTSDMYHGMSPEYAHRKLQRRVIDTVKNMRNQILD